MVEYQAVEIDELRNETKKFIGKNISIDGRLVELINGEMTVGCLENGYNVLGCLQVINACGIGEEGELRFTFGRKKFSYSDYESFDEAYYDKQVKMQGKLEKFIPAGIEINGKADYATIHFGFDRYHLRLEHLVILE